MSRPIIPIEQIGYGAALEQLNNALCEAYDNIQDPNTNPAAVRKVTLTVTLRPTPDRQKIKMESIASAKLAPANAYETVLYTGVTKDGEVQVASHDPRQQQMFDDNPNVAPLRQEGIN